LGRRLPRELRLIAERPLADLITPPGTNGVLEASGVIAHQHFFLVVFDNLQRVGRIHRSLQPGDKHGWLGPLRRGEGYEDIAYSAATRRLYLLIEAQKHPDGTYRAQIEECDQDGRAKARHWVDVSFEKRNRGFEGLTVVRRNGREYLLALCEGNRCRAGRKGRRPGGGRIHVLEKHRAGWRSVARIKLPRRAAFEDYSAIDLRGNRLAVTSQQTSQLWLGILSARDWTIAGPGRVYAFPRTKKGKRLYCGVEGIAWLTPSSFVAVSDAAKPDDPKRGRKKSQSIHLFKLPGPRSS